LGPHAGTPLHHDYTNENVELVTKGCCNLERHIRNTMKYGVPVVSGRVGVAPQACKHAGVTVPWPTLAVDGKGNQLVVH